MTIVDKLVWDYHLAQKNGDEKEAKKIADEIAKNNFKIIDMDDRFVLICTNEVNKEVGHNADISIYKTALEERFKNLK